ncbi:MAG: deoxyribonuclease IV [Mycobacteriales bacterium]
MSSKRKAPVGAQLKGGVAKGLEWADQVGAEAGQVFTGNSRAWKASAGDPEQDARFRHGRAARGMPVFVHTPYLVNLASPDAATLERSVATIRHILARAAAIGAEGVVVHGGQATVRATGGREAAYAQMRESLLPVLDEAPAGVRLLVEPAAGGPMALADTVPALGEYLDRLDRHPAAGVCLDTCHLWAAGHDLSSADGMRAMLDSYLATVGPGRLGLIHANDSRDPCGSGRDRHASLGEGQIGAEPFAVLFTHPASRGVPLIVETVDVNHAGDIATLKKLRGD